LEKRLQGKVIVVAGGGGIGGELARRYAREGAKVVLGDLDLTGAEDVVREIELAGGTAAAAFLDGGDAASIAALTALAEQNFGGLDGFHANFAHFGGMLLEDSIVDLPLEIFDEAMRVNIRGFVLCTRFAVPAMLRRGGGSMLYTSSGAAHTGEATRAAYGISKAAGHALMRHVARRYGPENIRANTIAPGVILHERLKASLGPGLDAFKEWGKSHIAVKTRLGAPGDIAAMSALLMSDEGSYITGQVISVDGGSTMRP
jgi:NAD(P)-dependent dehydrogenase (short-subunit alcohol dehydrogenase family)